MRGCVWGFGDAEEDAGDGVQRGNLEFGDRLVEVGPVVFAHPHDAPAGIHRANEVAEQARDVADGQVREGAVGGRGMAHLELAGAPGAPGEGCQVGFADEVGV